MKKYLLADSKMSATGVNGKNIRFGLGDIFANNFGDFWNNSTKIGEILYMSKIHFPTK